MINTETLSTLIIIVTILSVVGYAFDLFFHKHDL